MREHLRKFQERVMKQVLGLTLATKERWESQMRQMKEAGYEVNDSLSYEDMRKFHEKDEYEINLNREHYIGLEVAGHDTVLHALSVRKWRLCVTTREKGCFVTADRPVALTWNRPDVIPPLMRDSPGFGMADTEVLFPLTQNLALVGAFEGEDKTEEADTFFGAAANMRMVGFAFGYVYTPRRVFPYVGPGATYCHDRHFFETTAPLRREPRPEV